MNDIRVVGILGALLFSGIGLMAWFVPHILAYICFGLAAAIVAYCMFWAFILMATAR